VNIVYYTSGLTGWGRIVTGLSIANALKRKGILCEFTIVSNFQPSFQFENVHHIRIPVENEEILLSPNYQQSTLFKTLIDLKPDICLFDLIWYTTYNFIHEINCKKILLCRQVSDKFFSIPLQDKKLDFNPKHFDLLLATEPFKSSIKMDSISPIVIRNKDEILPKEEAAARLGVTGNRPVCLFAYNGEPGEFEAIKKKYSYLKDSEYQMLYSTNYSDKSFFPIVDYLNAVDFLISGAGYNAFWEIIYFNKEAIFEPVRRNFENQFWRVQNCQEFYFEENGADQLVDIIMNL
jgi:hypothetical protein